MIALTANAWSAIGVWATVAVYAGVLVYAIRQVGEARRLREQQLRPFVVAEFVPGFLITFRVKNYGQTMARNVRLRWDPWPETTFDEDPLWQAPEKSTLFSSGIPFLPPAQEITALFDHFPNRVGKNLRMSETIHVEYQAPDGRSFNERFDLDLEVFKGLRHIGRKDIDDVGKSLEKIAIELGRWTSGRGLRVSTSNLDRQNRIEVRPIRLNQARHIYKQEGRRGLAKYLIGRFQERTGWYFDK